MKSLSDVPRHTHSSLIRLIDWLTKKIKALEKTVEFQHQTLAKLKTAGQTNIHLLELEQERQLRYETQRKETMNHNQLKLELERQHGTTNWAKKLNTELLANRIEVIDITWPITGTKAVL